MEPDTPDGEAKIAQIGARIEQWITYRGFALNVGPNLVDFDLIVPCGIADRSRYVDDVAAPTSGRNARSARTYYRAIRRGVWDG